MTTKHSWEAVGVRIAYVADFVSTKLGYQEFLLAKWSARHGHEVHLITSDLNPPAPDYTKSFEPLLGPRKLAVGTTTEEGVRIHRLEGYGEIRSRIALRGLGPLLRSLAPDVVFIHGTMSAAIFSGARFASATKTPVFADNHMVFSVQDDTPAGRLTYSIARIVMRKYLSNRIRRFYGVAEECCDFLVEAQGVPPGQVALLPLGVDTDLFEFDPVGRHRLRSDWGVPESAIVIGQTGKMDGTKEPQTLARAAAEVMQVRPDVWTVFVGGGPQSERDAIREIMASRGLLDRVRMVPPVQVQELASVFSALDVVVYPGATSMSALEAAACGRAVIMNDLPASRWRASMGVGLTFPLGDTSALAAMLGRLVDDPRKCAEIGTEAQSAVLREFSYDRVAHELEEDMRSYTQVGK